MNSITKALDKASTSNTPAKVRYCGFRGADLGLQDTGIVRKLGASYCMGRVPLPKDRIAEIGTIHLGAVELYRAPGYHIPATPPRSRTRSARLPVDDSRRDYLPVSRVDRDAYRMALAVYAGRPRERWSGGSD